MKIVCAVDRSAVSDRVVAMVLDIARQPDSAVLLVNVAPREADVLGKQLTRKVVTDPVPEEFTDRRELLDRHAATFLEAEIACETLLIRGIPGRTLSNEAARWGADLIVMGSHGRGALYKRFIGSVSEAVLQDARKPVLVVPARANS
ncbi:MAG: universal stress protein [Pseudomonadota bacterium]